MENLLVLPLNGTLSLDPFDTIPYFFLGTAGIGTDTMGAGSDISTSTLLVPFNFPVISMVHSAMLTIYSHTIS